MSDTNEHEDIENVSNGRCTAGVSIKGQDFRCDYGTPHVGWAHFSAAVETAWMDSANWGDND